MAGVKFIISICLVSLSLTPIVYAKADINPLEISEKWFTEEGCPRVGPFNVECNSCYCPSALSKEAGCTLKACPETEIKEKWDNKGKSSCDPGKTFYHKCSKCTCDESGKTATCDDRACEHYGTWKTITAFQYVKSDKVLTISEKWYKKHGCPKKGTIQVECNTCTCPKARSNLAQCTLKFCPPTEIIDHWKQGVSKCKPGTSFFSQCNHCECDETGTEPTCDKRACKYY